MTGDLRVGKWIKGLHPDTPCVVAARLVLRKRLRAVDRLVQPAATAYAEDPEYVHQLRVASRRAGAALCAFRPFCRNKEFDQLRGAVRRLRRGAGTARQLDVQTDILRQEMQRADAAQHPAYEILIARLREEREAAQAAIVDAADRHRTLGSRKAVTRSMRPIRSRDSGVSTKRPFALESLGAMHVPTVLDEVKAWRQQDLSDPIALHGLRVAAKKLRYALELFMSCFPPQMKEELYPGVEDMLERLGSLNDLFELAEFTQHAATDAKTRASHNNLEHEPVGETALCEVARRFRERFHVSQNEFLQWWYSPQSTGLLDGLSEMVQALDCSASRVVRAVQSRSTNAEGAAPSERAAAAAASHRRVAAIDVGSNSIRLVVGETDSLTKYRVIEDIKETTRLGGGVFDEGRLTHSAMEASVRAVERMKEVALACRVDRIRAVATSAVREASNRAEFLDLVERRTGIRLEVIDPEQEARLAFSSVANIFELDDRRVAVVDIGGGSTELILSSGGMIDQVHPLPLGAVRLTERFQGADGREKFDDLRKHVDKVIDERLEGADYQPYVIIGTGGTFTSLARVAIRHGSSGVGNGRFLFAVRGYELRHADVIYFLEFLRRLPLEERRKVAGLSGQRAEIIVAGACIIERLMEHFGVDRMRVHDGGIRDGLLAEMIDELGFRAEPPRRHPPSSLDEIRDFASRSQYDAAHSEHVARLALRIFDQLIEFNPDALGTWGHAEARHLLHAGAILHDVGVAISYKGHHRHSYDMVVHAGLPGCTRREIEIIANLCRYHRRRGPSRRHEAFRRLGDDDQRLVRHLAGILRVADGLDRMHMQDVLDVRVTPTSTRTIFDVIAYVEPKQNMRAAKEKADVFELAFQIPTRFVFTPQKDAPAQVPKLEEVEVPA